MIRARLPANTAVIEEEKLTLHCVVVGTDPDITWTIHGGNKWNLVENVIVKSIPLFNR